MAGAGVAYYYKPDTKWVCLLTTISFFNLSISIQTWALNQAKSRMEERGELPKYEPSN